MLRFLTRYGTTKGLLGGSRAWTAVAVAGWAIRFLRRGGRGEPETVFSEVLRPGEVLEIRHLAAPAQAVTARPFTVGEKVIVVDAKGRQYLVTLLADGEFHTHAGLFEHRELLGREEGTTVRSTGGARYTAMRPTLTDFVFRMPRGAQVIYPKDLGPILIMADIHPGVRVLEAGVGSGALSMTMVRAGAEVVGYEVREDFARRARENVAAFVGAEAAEACYRVEVRDVYHGIDERGLDAVVLDLPEPWNVVPHAEAALRGGGTLLAYNPSITQAAQLREAMVDSGFELAETVEFLRRTWHVEGQAVRPDHRMVAHTGFLTSARLLGPVPGGLRAARLRS